MEWLFADILSSLHPDEPNAELHSKPLGGGPPGSWSSRFGSNLSARQPALIFLAMARVTDSFRHAWADSAPLLVGRLQLRHTNGHSASNLAWHTCWHEAI